MPPSYPIEGFRGLHKGHVVAYVPVGIPDETEVGMAILDGPTVQRLLLQSSDGAATVLPDEQTVRAAAVLGPGHVVLGLAGPPAMLLAISEGLRATVVAATAGAWRTGKLPRESVPPALLHALEFETWQEERRRNGG